MERRLTAILSADVVGYSRLMGANEIATLEALKALRADLLEPCIAEHNGRTFKLTGDGTLVEFPSVVSALECGLEIQRNMRQRNAAIADDRKIEDRKPIAIDKNSFDEVLAKQELNLTFGVPNLPDPSRPETWPTAVVVNPNETAGT